MKSFLDILKHEYINIDEAIYFSCRQSYTINLEGYPIPKNYIFELKNKLQNGEQIFYNRTWRNFMKYGKVTLEDDYIRFNSLSLPNTTQYSTLLNVKDFDFNENVEVFLKFSCIKTGEIFDIRIVLFQTELTKQFIDGCIRIHEDVSYLGKYFLGGNSNSQFDSIFPVVLPKFKDFKKPKSEDYKNRFIGSRTSKAYLGIGEIYVVGNYFGNFQIICLKVNTSSQNITPIGRVASHLERKLFSESTFLKIKECGVCISAKNE